MTSGVRNLLVIFHNFGLVSRAIEGLETGFVGGLVIDPALATWLILAASSISMTWLHPSEKPRYSRIHSPYRCYRCPIFFRQLSFLDIWHSINVDSIRVVSVETAGYEIIGA
jgi:hypothetical protein